MAESAISMATTTDRQRIAHERFQKILSSWNENSHHEMTEYYKQYGHDLRWTEKGGDDDDDLIQANSVEDSTTNDLKLELARNQAWVDVSNGRKCPVCRNLEPRAHPQSRVFRSGSRLISFLEVRNLQFFWDFGRPSGNKTCGYCDLIIRAVSELFLRTGWSKIIRQLQFSSLTLVEGQPIIITLDLVLESGWKDMGIEIFKCPDSEIPGLSVLGAAMPISTNAGSDHCVNFVQECLKDCTEHHQSCKLSDALLPKRVLLFQELAPRPENSLENPFSVRLYLSKPSDKQPYAALSHCWGEEPILRATKENVAALQEMVVWSELPKTFQDGIIIAHRLGLQYIWVDSLCIIQDNKDDWATEAAKMGDIYRSAYITIAAASSSCGKIGFLQDRSPANNPVAVKFYGPRKPSVARRIVSRFGIQKPTILYARHTSRVSSKETVIAGWSQTRPFNFEVPGPLSTRAWTLQERVLSTRIVNFSEEGIIWECLEEARSEDCRSSVPSLLSRWDDFQPVTALSGKYALQMRNKLQVFWRELLIEYTSRNIRYRTDILPAISSITARMHNLICSPYLAGLWQDRFIEDLCWRPAVSFSEKVPLLQPEDIALGMPTWSCFSIQHPIGFAVTDNVGVFVPHCEFVSSDFAFEQSQSPFALLGGHRVVL